MKRFPFYIILILILIAVVYSGYIVYIANQSAKVNYDTELSGKVSKTIDYKGQTYVRLKDKAGYWDIDISRNYDYQPNFLGDFLKSGDLIKKHSFSDTLFIYRNKNKFYFLIGDVLLNSDEYSDEWKEKWRNERRIIKEKNKNK